MPTDTWRDRRACVERIWTAVKAWLYDVEMLPLKGVYLISSSRGSLVISPSQRNSIYIALGFLCKPSIRTASHFPTP
jgi:hypothetical protein